MWPTTNPGQWQNGGNNWRRGAPMSVAPARVDNRNFWSIVNCSLSFSIIICPFALFDELIKGVEMDLDIKRYADYPALEQYCYRVASVVGLLSIEIFGYHDPACRDYAIFLGKALQLTNILRDVRSDAERGRIYLPLSELAHFRVEPEEILRLEYSPRFRDLAVSVGGRARHFYQQARITLPAVDHRAMVAAELMGSVYWRLLRKLERRQFDVFGPKPARLGKGQKMLLILRTGLRLASGAMAPNYGTP